MTAIGDPLAPQTERLDADAVAARVATLSAAARARALEELANDIRILSHTPGRTLTIALEISRLERGCAATSAVVPWSLFPSLLGYLAVENSLAPPLPPVVGAIGGAAVGLAAWWRLLQLGPTIRINLESRTHVATYVGGFRWAPALPAVDIVTECSDDAWRSSVRLAGRSIASRTGMATRAEAEDPMLRVACALLTLMGQAGAQ